MIARLAWHELQQQLRGRVFWIVFAISALMVAGSMMIDELRVGLVDEGSRLGAAAIMRMNLVWSLFFLFTCAALVGEAVLRDRLTGFADVVRATPVSRWRYAVARFVGSFGAVVLCFMSVPMAMVAAGSAFGLEGGAAQGYVFAFLVLALPNLLLASALFFVLAGVTRSMTGCLLGATGLLTVYRLGSDTGGLALIEPFGFAAIADATRNWAQEALDFSYPAMGGVLLANRVLWLALAGLLVALGTRLAGDDRRTSGSRHLPTAATAHDSSSAVSPQYAGPLHRHPAPEWKIAAVQLWTRTWFETRRAVFKPVFGALLIMGLVTATTAAAKVTGTPATVATLTSAFQLVPVVVVLFFAGELYWAEHEHRVSHLIAVTPVHQALLVLPKLLALALVLLLLALASAASGFVVEVARGHSPQGSVYLAWYVLPRTYDWLLLAALALFLQSLAPNKLAGWGFLILYLVGSLALNKLGWQDPHYRFGSYPGAPLPPQLSGMHNVGWYKLGWGLVDAALIAISCRPRPSR